MRKIITVLGLYGGKEEKKAEKITENSKTFIVQYLSKRIMTQ